jgi:hypothetical protein
MEFRSKKQDYRSRRLSTLNKYAACALVAANQVALGALGERMRALSGLINEQAIQGDPCSGLSLLH